jgi:hypothetical protein
MTLENLMTDHFAQQTAGRKPDKISSGKIKWQSWSDAVQRQIQSRLLRFDIGLFTPKTV